MGREWYWGGKSSKRGGAGGEKDTSSSSSSSGCMNAVFQFFHFHQFQFPLHHQQPSFESSSILPEEPTIPKGAEAPRNSLQSEELLLSHFTRERAVEEEDLNIPMGIQIKTSGRTGSNSEISGSPATKTPSLVARLMGLDLLPETHSPSSSSKTSRLQPLRRRLPLQSTGTQSLPETPRRSSSRRSDVDHHRLSLQINKENSSPSTEDLEFSRFSYLRRRELRVVEDSPSQYAKQIVKQMKEKVSRKVGYDITNTITNGRDHQGRTDNQLVSQLKSRKLSKAFAKAVEDQPKTKPSTKDRSSSSALHFSKTSSPSQVLSSVPVNVQPKFQTLQKQTVPSGQKSMEKSKKIGGERFGQRLKKPPQTSDIIRNKQEEPFVRPSTATRASTSDKKCKKTPLSNELLSITVPTLLPLKKDPSPPPTRIPPKQSQVFDDDQKSRFSCSSQTSYKQQEATETLMTRETSNGASATGAEYEFVANILSRTGIQKDTLVSFTNWFSPSHPLDPAVFQQLDYYSSNKRLLFHLVDELLVGILKPYMNMKPWVAATCSSNGHGYNCHMQGTQLFETLCDKIRSFPRANCRVLEDIDGLIEKDLPKLKLQSAMAFEEVGEEIVTEIEKDIVDTLVHETVLEFW